MLVDVPPVYHEDQEPYIEKKVSNLRFRAPFVGHCAELVASARIAQELREHLIADGVTEEDIYDRRSLPRTCVAGACEN